MDLKKAVLVCLRGPLRTQFLACLGHSLGIYLRTEHRQPSQRPQFRDPRFVANEMGIVIFLQIQADLDPSIPGYPDDALLEVLYERAAAGDILHHLKAAFADAVKQTKGASGGSSQCGV